MKRILLLDWKSEMWTKPILQRYTIKYKTFILLIKYKKLNINNKFRKIFEEYIQSWAIFKKYFRQILKVFLKQIWVLRKFWENIEKVVKFKENINKIWLIYWNFIVENFEKCH